MISYNSVTLLDSTFSVPAIFLFASFISFSSKRHFLVSSILSFQTWIQLHICLTQFLFRKQQTLSLSFRFCRPPPSRLYIVDTSLQNFPSLSSSRLHCLRCTGFNCEFNIQTKLSTEKSHFAFWSSRKKDTLCQLSKIAILS